MRQTAAVGSPPTAPSDDRRTLTRSALPGAASDETTGRYGPIAGHIVQSGPTPIHVQRLCTEMHTTMTPIPFRPAEPSIANGLGGRTELRPCHVNAYFINSLQD